MWNYLPPMRKPNTQEFSHLTKPWPHYEPDNEKGQWRRKVKLKLYCFMTEPCHLFPDPDSQPLPPMYISFVQFFPISPNSSEHWCLLSVVSAIALLGLDKIASKPQTSRLRSWLHLLASCVASDQNFLRTCLLNKWL